MTPQLMQAIKLLQLSNLDLSAYVETELERNPLLERGARPSPRASRRRRSATALRPRSGRRLIGRTARDGDDRHAREQLDTDPDVGGADDGGAAPARASADMPSGYSEWGAASAGRRDDGEYNLEAFVSAERTLADHLAEQLALAIADPARRMIAQYLIDLVDEAGYLTGDLGAGRRKARRVAVGGRRRAGDPAGFDPPGVCARNLTECLAIQLRERDRFDPAMQAWSAISIFSPSAISPRCERSAA